jgi:diguanylate cyclase (GGDEF)-like protein/PAS domain S-box-containing protein
MSSLAFKAAKQTKTRAAGECILLVEASPRDAATILEALGSAMNEPYCVDWAIDLSSAIKRVCDGGVGAVLLDLTLPDSHGIETFDKLHQAVPRVPILILSEVDAEEMARQTVEKGAADYLAKDQLDGYQLSRVVRVMMDCNALESKQLENEAAAILDSIGEAVLRIDSDLKIVYLNQAAEKMTGWRRDEARGLALLEVFRLSDGVRGAAFADALRMALQDDEAALAVPTGANTILVRRDGSGCGIETKVALIREHGGRVTGAVVSFNDVSAARAILLQLMHSAEHDALTDLPNRVLFGDRLTQAISLAERQRKQLAVMFVDLDRFKGINDSMGHVVGDKLLQSVARRLSACVRRSDTVSRIGGDEFVILLSQIEHGEDAAPSARKILRSFGAPHLIEGASLDISASIGISTYPGDGDNAETLMNRADNAMYEAKQHGRNNYQFFQQVMHSRLAERQSLESALRCALGRQELLLHYQPKIDLQTGKISGVEALLRWLHPERGMISPAQFIPIAEDCGLILSIGRWVLLEACRQAQEWRKEGFGNMPIAVNVSASEFGARDFLSAVRAVLIATGMEPQNLELELTESVLMADAETAVFTLEALKAMGVRLAVDDFGTGYSSFTYLRRFPIDTLKIHQSFLHDIADDPRDAAIVISMVDIAKGLKHRVVAEGIETRDQLRFLRCHGCDEGQGYYFSRPVAAEQAGKLFKSGIGNELLNSSPCSAISHPGGSNRLD